MAENNKTRFFYALYSDKTLVFDQSERALYPIYIIKRYIAVVFKGEDMTENTGKHRIVQDPRHQTRDMSGYFTSTNFLDTKLDIICSFCTK